MIKQMLLSSFIALLVISACMDVSAQQRPEKRILVFRSPFRYVIVHNEIDPSLGGTDSERRFIEVLIDNKSFSKKNLIMLIQLISERFPSPGLLYVNVFSNLEDVETPEEREKPKTSNTYSSSPNQKVTATFVRLPNNKMRLTITHNGDHEEVEVK